VALAGTEAKQLKDREFSGSDAALHILVVSGYHTLLEEAKYVFGEETTRMPDP